MTENLQKKKSTREHKRRKMFKGEGSRILRGSQGGID